MYIRNPDTNKWEEVFLPPTGDTLPVGSISAYGGEKIPTNWLKCNGEAISRTDYPDLFKAIGTTYGSGDGSKTFNLPDLSERVAVGNAGDGEFSLGTTGGEKTHTLTVDEMPAHKHELTIEGGGSLDASGVKWLSGTNMRKYAGDMIENAGGSKAHNNMQPYIALNFIIKAKQSVGVVGTVTSNINDINDNAVPSAKTVKDYVKEIYSTNEVKTNKVWIDGKPIYRIVINMGDIPSNSSKIINHNIKNIDFVTSVSGLGVTSTNHYNIPFSPNEAMFSGLSVSMRASSTEISVSASKVVSGHTIYGIMEYTKTTD